MPTHWGQKVNLKEHSETISLVEEHANASTRVKVIQHAETNEVV